MPGDFLDTDVLVYLAQSDAVKAERAEHLLEQKAVLSVQVLNELANVLRRKAGFSWAETNSFLEVVRAVAEVVPLTVETHEIGLTLAERYKLSIYDAMMAAAALEAGCDVLWSEDMHDGLEIDGQLRVRNPFADVI